MSTKSRGSSYLGALLVGTALLAPGGAEVAGVSNSVDMMSRYCTACWRNARLQPDTWGDCTQEVSTRLLQRVRPESWQNVFREETAERKEFLRAIDTVKKRWQRARHEGSLATEEADRHELERQQTHNLRKETDEAAARVLSPRQQRILTFCFDGWSAQEIGLAMGLPAPRVSDEKYKAIRRLQRHLISEA
jgi:RNA polymerase sigma factor (sigma-70 family)